MNTGTFLYNLLPVLSSAIYRVFISYFFLMYVCDNNTVFFVCQYLVEKTSFHLLILLDVVLNSYSLCITTTLQYSSIINFHTIADNTLFIKHYRPFLRLQSRHLLSLNLLNIFLRFWRILRHRSADFPHYRAYFFPNIIMIDCRYISTLYAVLSQFLLCLENAKKLGAVFYRLILHTSIYDFADLSKIVK